MTVQTTYTKNMPIGIEGQIAYDFGTADTASFVASEDIEFGRLVKRGPADEDGSVKKGSDPDFLTDDNVIGCTVRSLLQQEAITNNTTQYGHTETK